MLHRDLPQASQEANASRSPSLLPCSTGILHAWLRIALTRDCTGIPLKTTPNYYGKIHVRTMPSPPSVSMPSIQAAIFSICGVTGLFCCRMRSSILAPGPCFACPLPAPPLPACPGAPRPLGPAGLPLQ